MIRSIGYGLVTDQALSRSSTGSTRPAVAPICLTPAQRAEIFEAQSGFPFRADVIRRFTPPSDQAIDLQRRILQELNRIFTKHGKKQPKEFEQAVHNDFAIYLNKQHKMIELGAAQCWKDQLKAAFTAANKALSDNRRPTATLTTRPLVAAFSEAQRIDTEFRKRIAIHISDKEVIKILSDELGIILERNRNVRPFAAAVLHDLEKFVRFQPYMDEGDLAFIIDDLENAMKIANQKEREEEKKVAAEMIMAPTLAVTLSVPVSSSNLVSQTNPTVMQRIQAVFTKVWSLILSFFANLVKRFQK